MPLSEPAATALAFIDRINARDLTGLAGLMTKDHLFLDSAGHQERGRAAMRKGWQGYFRLAPDYRIYVARIFVDGDTVTIHGHTTGSHLGLPDVEEFHEHTVFWQAATIDGQVAEWRIYEDTPEQAEQLNLKADCEVFDVPSLAATIDRHLHLLRGPSTVPNVRAVRRFYSERLKKMPPREMIRLAETLRSDYGQEFTAYELINHHPSAIDNLTPSAVDRLTKGISTWQGTDTFALCVGGPAWRKGVLTDEWIHRRIRSRDFWQRRAALVCSIYLKGDVPRALELCRMLVDDHEDMIVKGVSWVLRSMIRYDRPAVERFMAEYDNRLAARIKREVRNKLTTGLKTPRQKK